MKRNVHVAKACDRIIVQIREHVRSLNERRDILDRIARLPFSEDVDLTLAAGLNEMADNMEPAVAEGRGVLESFKRMERDYRNASADSVRK
jgi:hypothetical protein